jgi:predicted acetyltransferase
MTDATSRSAARWPVRTLGRDAWEAFVEVDSHAFGFTVPSEVTESEEEYFGQGRDIGAYDVGAAGETLAGIATAYPFELTVPGGRVRAAGVSWVGVLPTYRRRGVLSALMDHQLTALHEQGEEPVAVLWASEPQIYGRYGYGLASRYWSCSVPRGATALLPETPADDSLRLRLVPAADWKRLAAVYDAVLPDRPGMFARDERWWTRAVRDFAAFREGKSALRCVVAEDEGGVRGYALYATKGGFGDDFGKGTVSVREVLAADPAALAAVYRYLFDLDLMGTTSLWNVPVDDPLGHWLTNPRSAKPQTADALYVRLVDVDSALAARRYAADVDAVLEVRDTRCPWNAGRWRLTGGPEGASCVRTDDTAEIELDVRELGAAYLGSTSLVELAAAGRVSGEPTAVRRVATAFAHAPAAWCPTVF